jgi:hypothetical protein
MATEWSKVPDDVLKLAQDIIWEHHPELTEFAIGFIFRSEASISGGKMVLGQASKVTGKYSPFIDLDGLVWLAADVWTTLSMHQKRALIDHELCHFEVNQEGALTMRGHDIEEFKCIIERYGLWKSDLIAFAPAVIQASQVRLPGFERNGRGVVAVEPETFKVEVVSFEMQEAEEVV